MPLRGVAVNRIRAFVEYLDKSKYTVSVITLHSDGAKHEETLYDSKIYRLKNKSFLKLPQFDRSTSKLVHYFKVIWKLIVLNLVKDEYSDWRKKAVKKLNEINQSNTIDVVLSSYAPSSAHIAAHQFCIKNPNVKWVVDMRDEMSENPFIGRIQQNKYEKIEKHIQKNANALITVSKPILDNFKKSITGLNYYVEIRNGFAHEEQFEKYQFNETFTITYAGTFHGIKKPDLFLKIIAKLEKENQLPEKWKIQFIGTIKNFDIPIDIADKIEFYPKKSYLEVIKICRNSDVNLLIIKADDTRKGVYSGKLFDYISVEKPIIALVNKDDVAAELINELNAGYIASLSDSEEIEKAIKQAVLDWKTKTILNIDKTKIKELHRKHQVKKLEYLIETMLNEK